MPLALLCAAARFSPADAAAGTRAAAAKAARRFARHPFVRAVRAGFGLALRAAGAFCRAYAARRLLREMRDWPNERLRDIGITRAELAAAILGISRPFRWTPAIDPDAPPPAH